MDCKEFFYRLGRTIYKIDGHYSEFAKNIKVKSNLLWIMYALNDGKSHSQKQICEEWDLPMTTINTIVKDLEKENYVKLEKISGKKREMNIILTQEGKKLADKLLSSLYKKEEETFNRIKSKAQSIILELEEFEENLSSVFGKKQ